MSVMIDLIGSTVIAALMIMMGLQLNANMTGTANSSMARLNVQESLVEVIGAVEADFRKIGYGMVDPKYAIAVNDSNHIRFRADMNRDGTIDSVDWWLGGLTGGCSNPRVRSLYRRVNNGPAQLAALNVTSFRLKYMTQDGQVTNVLTQIWIIETTLALESPYQVDDEVKMDERAVERGFAGGFWRQTRLSTRNVKRHG